MRASWVISHSDSVVETEVCAWAESVGESDLKAFAPMMKPRAICAIV